jgi:hypothetical protein
MFGNKLARGTGMKLCAPPFAQVIGGRAICPDGVVRALAYIGEADTVWTRPAAVRVKGKYIRGYVEIETEQGMSAACSIEGDPNVLKFIALPDYHARAFGELPRTWKRLPDMPREWQAPGEDEATLHARDMAGEAEAYRRECEE